MQRRIRAIVLDTSYLLPFFGIKVENLDPVDVRRVIELSKRLGIEIIYPRIMVLELLAKLFREAEKHSLRSLPLVVKEKLRSLLLSGEMILEDLAPEHIDIIERLRLAGFRDLFDCVAYAVAKMRRSIFMTMDRAFKQFLLSIGEEAELLKDHREVLYMIEELASSTESKGMK